MKDGTRKKRFYTWLILMTMVLGILQVARPILALENNPSEIPRIIVGGDY
ncbi:MAG: hypothetical protein H8E17_00880 [Deltaproteobacteria bacterium]|nr:hypothetical protein [Deltaproteobacteria bacterium]